MLYSQTHESSEKPKMALVLSAGGGFGAYQVGAWSVLSRHGVHPDIVIGASIGSLNGWAIAGGMPAEELCEFWRSLEVASQLKFRLASPWNGFVDGTVLERAARELFSRYPARLEYGAVMTEWRTMRPRLFRTAEVTWRHLYGSCAIPFVFKQQRFRGRLHSDGGLLGALPLWAAAEFGATYTIAIDVWQAGLARFRKQIAPQKNVTILTPSQKLGSARESLFWKRDQVDRWMSLGASDAQRLIDSGELQENISIPECFKRQ